MVCSKFACNCVYIKISIINISNDRSHQQQYKYNQQEGGAAIWGLWGDGMPSIFNRDKNLQEMMLFRTGKSP
jgi:hypothetical protein